MAYVWIMEIWGFFQYFWGGLKELKIGWIKYVGGYFFGDR
jgi:hypothetical protein